MGEVFRARDTRLDRTVAIKSLPPSFGADAERLARFEREAKLLASLTHPNIAGIFGLEDVSGTPYLVLEFIEGETLAQRLARGPLTVRETLTICGQVASAVEAAHDRGIVHRDLKPANIMITTTGVAKVLDFGLAKGGAVEDGSSMSLSASPTVAATGQGVILGTAPYMSPEQARGRPVDRRADVWAFGCIAFECLTGQPAFSGETVSDVLAKILEREPDYRALPPSTPVRLRELIQRCLTKDASERPRDIGDLRREISAITAQLGSRSSGFAAPTAFAADVPSLAVLYFENLSSDQESDYFCAGITEDILTDLSKIKGLRVASRNAVARYRGKPADVPTVAADLGVRAVLEGSVRRAGGRVRISAQLINASDGFHLWAERYDRTLEDVFAVQEEIAKSIAGALQVALSPAETKSLVQDRPDDVRAYDLYLRGRQRYGSYTKESLQEAMELFRKAIELEPDYALAWAGIADCYGQLLQYDLGNDREEITRLGLDAAHKAVALNPKLAEGHKAEALVLRFSGDTVGSKAALVRALQANPRFNPALINLAVHCFSNGDIAAAERFIRRALEVDPQDAFATTWLGQIQVHTGRLDDALETAARLPAMSTDPFYITAAYAFPIHIHLRRGDLAAAERTIQEGTAAGARKSMMQAFLSVIALRSGRTAEAAKLLDEIEPAQIGPAGLISVAGVCIRLGDMDRAVQFMSRRFIRDFDHILVRLEPDLHPLLDHDHFAPRRLDGALIWPLEAPMLPAAVHAVFREVRIESGLPQGSDIISSR
jgi:serine/threonine protein kinase